MFPSQPPVMNKNLPPPLPPHGLKPGPSLPVKPKELKEDLANMKTYPTISVCFVKSQSHFVEL